MSQVLSDVPLAARQCGRQDPNSQRPTPAPQDSCAAVRRQFTSTTAFFVLSQNTCEHSGQHGAPLCASAVQEANSHSLETQEQQKRTPRPSPSAPLLVSRQPWTKTSNFTVDVIALRLHPTFSLSLHAGSFL